MQDGVDSPAHIGPSGSAARRPTHRDDIQGLRAIAVGVVVLAHAGFGAMAGGFIGVDVFFVISGFLITQLLLREAALSGRVSLIGFYARRARRILPASTLVLVATVIASTLWLSIFRVPSVLRDAVWAALFAANVRFADEGTDYFTSDQPPSPLQHYWSLAVEEQFYLVWPLLIVAVLVIARRRVGIGGSPLPLLAAVLVAVSGTSLAWSVHATGTDTTSAYFSTLTRAWELGLGALAAVLLALLAARGQHRTLPPLVAEIVATAGLAAIAVACLGYDDHTPFPGIAALLPVLGTAALLVVGGAGGGATLVARVLSVRPATALGDWSYSLYLWHWPLLIIPAGYLGHDLTATERVFLVVLALGLSWASYRLVETPLRKPRRWSMGARPILLYPVTVALVLGTAVSANGYLRSSLSHGDAPAVTLGAHWRQEYHTNDRSVALVRASLAAARRHQAMPGQLHPSLADLLASVPDLGKCEYQDDSVRTLCPRGDVDGDRTLVVIGNSHGRHWIPAFERIARRAGYRAYYLVKVQCVGALVIPDRAGSGKAFEECGDFHEWALQQIAELHPDLVVLATSSGDHGVWDDEGVRHTDRAEVDELLYQGYVDMLDAIEAHTDRTVLLEDIPQPRQDPAPCLSRRPDHLGTCLQPMAKHYHRTISVQQRAARTAGVEDIATHQWVCSNKMCPPVVGDMIVYRDRGHMTNEYSASLAEPLRAALGL